MNEADTTIQLTLDGRPHTVASDTDLAALVAAIGHEPNTVSTAVNGMFVPRAQRQACVLRDGDAVLLFQPIVGG
jgi:sulfur carrier protein